MQMLVIKNHWLIQPMLKNMMIKLDPQMAIIEPSKVGREGFTYWDQMQG